MNESVNSCQNSCQIFILPLIYTFNGLLYQNLIPSNTKQLKSIVGYDLKKRLKGQFTELEPERKVLSTSRKVENLVGSDRNLTRTRIF